MLNFVTLCLLRVLAEIKYYLISIMSFFDNNCRLRKQKIILALYLIGFVCGFMIANLFSLTIQSESESISSTLTNEMKEQETDPIRCKVPRLDPWDPSIKQWIEHPQGVECAKVQPYMTFMDAEGYLQLNETEVNILTDQNITFNCTYWTFDRNVGLDDESIWYDAEVRLINKTKLLKDTVDVACRYENNTEFYWNVYAFPVIRDDLTFAEPSEEQINVLFFIVDSVAHTVLQRNLPLTYNYTKNVMGIKFFNGFNKIGTNSFPNQMAMLTGKRMYYETDEMARELPRGYDYYTQRFDSWPLIWRFFAAKGYATVFNCDWPSFSLFNYHAVGFSKKLMDYYYHWFWRRVDRQTIRDSSRYCFSNEPIPKIHLDLTKNHIIKLQNTSNFIFHVLTETTHSGDNEIERTDRFHLEFFKEMYEGNYFNKTFIIFASDHGIRLGNIRPTYAGAMEDRLPFYGLWFPQWFYDNHPNIKQNIENNLDALTSSFDVFETLKDIAHENFNGVQKSAKSRGQSHLYPVPRNRTCKDAGIADHWCTCNKETIVNPENNSLAEEAATFLVDHMNNLLKDYQNLCQKIVFSKFNFFRQVGLLEEENHVNKQNDTEKISNKKTHYFVGIETSPYNAAFEAYLTVISTNKTDENKWELKGGLDRSSRYGPYSDCIDDWWLTHFCPCYNSSKNSQ